MMQCTSHMDCPDPYVQGSLSAVGMSICHCVCTRGWSCTPPYMKMTLTDEERHFLKLLTNASTLGIDIERMVNRAINHLNEYNNCKDTIAYDIVEIVFYRECDFYFDGFTLFCNLHDTSENLLMPLQSKYDCVRIQSGCINDTSIQIILSGTDMYALWRQIEFLIKRHP